MSHSANRFTRRKMLFFGFGSMGAVGAIALKLMQVQRSSSEQRLRASKVIDLELFSFLTVKLNSQGDIIQRETLQGQQFISIFGIKMVTIAGGSFTMGSAVTEVQRWNNEGPQHTVTIPNFFMSKTPVTQEQWKAVAALPKVNIDLRSNPSNFKGDRLPVEQVDWKEAVEFCDRLKAHTGLDYRLPSEAEWEYACRAGTETPFYFGETISTDVANFDGDGRYDQGKKGRYLKKTTAVETYPANAWGLYDMHGNVMEWCADSYHYNYDGAPNDGSVRHRWSLLNSPNDSVVKILRGGSWDNRPANCRSAYRYVLLNRSTINSNVGFRVACSQFLPGTL